MSDGKQETPTPPAALQKPQSEPAKISHPTQIKFKDQNSTPNQDKILDQDAWWRALDRHWQQLMASFQHVYGDKGMNHFLWAMPNEEQQRIQKWTRAQYLGQLRDLRNEKAAGELIDFLDDVYEKAQDHPSTLMWPAWNVLLELRSSYDDFFGID